MDTRQQDGKRLLAFFKFFVPDRSKDRLMADDVWKCDNYGFLMNKVPDLVIKFFFNHLLKIPTAFTSYMKEKIPPRALIRDRYGNMWPVAVARIEDDFFFLDGWAKYVQDNSVELGDFLVFQYDGHSVYDVKLLGHSACEKKGVGALTVKEEDKEIEEDDDDDEEGVEEEEEEGEEEEKETNEVQQQEEQGDESYPDATEMDVDSNYSKEDEDHSTEDEENDEEQEEEEDMEEEQAAKTSKTDGIVDSKLPPKGFKRTKGGMQEAKDANGKEDSRRQVDPYGRDLFRSRKISQPKNPYFVTKIRAARRDELYVPSDVVKDHNLNLPPNIILRDKQGREWSSKLKPWKDGRLWYYGGWGNLCRVNIVGDDDTCICEFKRRVGGGLYIQVHIVRIN